MCRPNSITSLLVASLAFAGTWTSLVSAQSPETPEPGLTQQANQNAYVAVVTSDDVYVRAGAGSSYYPFGKLRSGDFVQVVGEKFGWARVRTVGPAFRNFFGYIKYPKEETGRFRLEDSGQSGVALGVMEILAPNLNTKNDPRDSWKWLIKLSPDDRVKVLESFETEQETVHKVALPSEAEGWISAAYVRPASPQESETFKLALEDPTMMGESPAEPLPVQATDRSAPVRAGSGEVQPASNDAPRAAQRDPRADLPAAGSSRLAARTVQNDHPPVPVASDDRDFADPVADSETWDDEQAEPSTIEQDPLDADVQNPDDAATDEEPASTSVAKPSKEPTLDDLEQALERLTKQPLETAEVAPLRKMYLDLSERTDRENTKRYAQARADQLSLWMDAQLRKQELARLREKTSVVLSETDQARHAMDLRSEYVAVGRLETSTIFDGSRLPRLLRLQESSTGRTIAYLQPNNDIDLISMVGQLIGIVGDKSFDPGLRLNIVQPRRIDLLTPQGGKTEPILTHEPEPSTP